jgi:hypothetical protein
MASVEALTLNGVDLNGLVSNVESVAGLLRTPVRRGESIRVPGRHGALRRADRPYDPGEITLPFWVIGAHPATGVALTGDEEASSYYARADALVALLHAPDLLFEHTLPDGTSRRCRAELADEPLDFTRQAGSPLFGRVSVALSLPDAFWYEPVLRPAGPYTVVTGAPVELAPFAGATAPMAGLQITFTGPINNPELRQPETGSFVAYDAVIGSGQTVTIDCDTETITASGGLVVDYTKLRYRPPRWFELDPTAGLEVQLVHTTGGSRMFTVAGQRKFLTG